MSRWLAESYSPGIRRDDVAAAERRADEAVAELRSQGVEVAYLGALLVASDEVVFHAFEAAEAAAVAEAVARSGIRAARIVEAEAVPAGRAPDVLTSLLQPPAQP